MPSWPKTILFYAAFAGSIVAVVLLMEEILLLAKAWPGGPGVFVPSLAVLSILSLFAITEIQISARAPHMASATMRRIPDRVQNVALKVSAAVFAICLLLAPTTVIGEKGSGCQRKETLTCWFEENNNEHIVLLSGVLWLVLLTAFAMSAIVRFSTGADRRYRATGLSFSMGAILFPLFALMAVSVSRGPLFTLAENWPGGVDGFAIGIGLVVTGGLLTAVIGWRARSRWRPYWKTAVTVSVAAFTSVFALAVLVFLNPTDKELEGVVCEREFPCGLTASIDRVDSAVTLGFLVAGIGVLAVVLTVAVLTYRRRSAARRAEAERSVDEAGG